MGSAQGTLQGKEVQRQERHKHVYLIPPAFSLPFSAVVQDHRNHLSHVCDMQGQRRVPGSGVCFHRLPDVLKLVVF